jgi:hypothetical protein
MILLMFGFPTGDLNPIYNAPMLGAQSGRRGILAPAPHTTGHAGPHRAVPIRRSGSPPTARHGTMAMSQASHASHRIGAYRPPRPCGCHRCQYPLRGRMPADQFSPSPLIETSGFCVSTGGLPPPARCSATMASADFPRHFLRGISPGKNALLSCTSAAFTSTGKPVDFVVWCPLIVPCRPSMRFLFIGSRFSPSLPSHGRSPFRSWPQLVFYSHGSYTGDLNPFWTAPMLGAHKWMRWIFNSLRLLKTSDPSR